MIVTFAPLAVIAANIDDVNKFNDDVLSSILVNLVNADALNSFNDVLPFDAVKLFTDAVAADNESTLLDNEPPPAPPTDELNAKIEADTFVILSLNTLPLYWYPEI